MILVAVRTKRMLVVVGSHVASVFSLFTISTVALPHHTYAYFPNSSRLPRAVRKGATRRQVGSKTTPRSVHAPARPPLDWRHTGAAEDSVVFFKKNWPAPRADPQARICREICNGSADQ